MSVEFNPKNRSILKRTVEMMGWSMVSDNLIRTFQGTITLDAGKASGEQNEVNQLRKSYSQCCLDVQQQWAKQRGWTVQRESPNKMRVSKKR